MLAGLLSGVIDFLQHIYDQLENADEPRKDRTVQVKMLIDEHRHNEHTAPKGVVRIDCPLCQLRRQES